MDQRFEQTAFYPADILLPQTAEMKKWPVVACDQFTSQPDYWQWSKRWERHPRRCGWCCRRSI